MKPSRVVLRAIAFALLALLGSVSTSWACSGVTGISPSSGPAAGGTVVTIIGSGFQCDGSGATAVKFGSTIASFSVQTDSQLTATTPAGTGTVDVTVTVNGTDYTLHAAFTYTSANTDSQTIKTLQDTVTTSVASVSADVIAGAVDGAIGDGFSDTGAAPITGGPNGLAFNFAPEPRHDTRTQEAFDALAYAGGFNKAPPRAPLLLREWSAWADLRGTGFDRNDSGAGTHGHQVNLTAGIGRRLTQDLLVGVFTGYENFNFTMDSIAGKMTGDGGSIGTYAGWRFASHWRADAMLGWTKVSYSARAGSAAGDFGGSRWLASGGFTGSYRYDALTLEPSARIHTLWERDADWTDSLGTAQAARSFSAGRISGGGKAIYPAEIGAGARLAPYVGLYGDWRFASDSALPVNAANTGIKDGWSARVTGGVTTTTAAGLALSLGGELGGLGAGYEIWSVKGRAALPF